LGNITETGIFLLKNPLGNMIGAVDNFTQYAIIVYVVITKNGIERESAEVTFLAKLLINRPHGSVGYPAAAQALKPPSML
jgi:hypothetical protein